jgi:hypothetical protein
MRRINGSPGGVVLVRLGLLSDEGGDDMLMRLGAMLKSRVFLHRIDISLTSEHTSEELQKR